MGKNSIRSSRK